MRLYLLPVSTRRTLLYCQRAETVNDKQTWMDKIQTRAARMWAGWEKKDSGWQKKVVEYGNHAFRRIPYEEWGLKSVPPLSTARRNDEAAGKTKIEVVFPGHLVSKDVVPSILQRLSTERESLHRSRLVWSIVGMPITAPVALIPVVPNIPFFYLVYRAWSHWRALAGGRHIQFLLQNKLLTLSPSSVLDRVYIDQKHPLASSPKPATESSPSAQAGLPGGDAGINHPDPAAARDSPHHPEGEVMLLSQENGRRMTEALDLPQLEVELERAIWQVETAIKSQAGATDPSPSSEQPRPGSGDSAQVPGLKSRSPPASNDSRPEQKKDQ